MNYINFFLFAIFFIFLIGIILYQIKEEFKPESRDPVINKIKNKLRLVYPDIDRLEFYESNKSYTINKHKVHLCIKDKNGDYYNENMLTYVALHELAHVLCDEIDHTDKFYEIFQNLLDKASAMGLYDPDQPVIQDYCEY
jgi:hypothetical protein